MEAGDFHVVCKSFHPLAIAFSHLAREYGQFQLPLKLISRGEINQLNLKIMEHQKQFEFRVTIDHKAI